MGDTGEPYWTRSEQSGDVSWNGPRDWTVRRGPALLVFHDGNLDRVENCRLPNSERATIDYQPFSFDAPARREGSAGLDGHKWPGDIVIGADDVSFTDWPELEADLLASERICTLVKTSDFADRLYAALCNIDWFRDAYLWSTSWREAGRIVARLQGDCTDRAYLRFYSRIEATPGSPDEGTVVPEVAGALAALGWSWQRMARPDKQALHAMANARRLTFALALDSVD